MLRASRPWPRWWLPGDTRALWCLPTATSKSRWPNPTRWRTSPAPVKGCRLLETKDVAISLKSCGVDALGHQGAAQTLWWTRWTYALAINDIYFDYAAPELTQAGKSSTSISMLSAGDGSAAAFLRIQAGTFQMGTVSEPLNLHGWQLVDNSTGCWRTRPSVAISFQCIWLPTTTSHTTAAISGGIRPG